MSQQSRIRRARILSRIALGLALLFMSVGWTLGGASGQPAKIWLTENLLMRSVPNEGITFYDIAQPAAPRSLGVLPLKENIDLAVAGTTLYVDSASALLVYNIANPSSPQRLATVSNLFQSYQQFDEFGGMRGCSWLYGCAENATSPAGGSSQGGSLARFAITGNRLYCIDGASIVALDISNRADPRLLGRVQTSWTVETLFPLDTLLFVGGTDEMTIYSVAGGDVPEYVGGYTHLRTCDPVVVEGNRAYVTLRGGSRCGGYTNQLDILDISDINAPRLITSWNLTSPYGLAVRDSIVVVCDSRGGLRTIDTRNVAAIRETATIGDLWPYDVILRGNLLVVTASDGYYLYDATDLASLRKFSRIVP